jgi:GNAT superfamily N-acetyltransferase
LILRGARTEPSSSLQGGRRLRYLPGMDDTSHSSEPLRVRPVSAVETHPLRMAILRPGYPESASVFAGDDDAATMHAGVLRGDELVGIASIYLESRPVDAPGGAACRPDHAAGTAWRLRGMATAPSVRRRGAGAATLEACIAHARAAGGTVAWCNARIEAIPFYESQGWDMLGAQFDLPTVGLHFVMERRIDD